MVNFTVDQVRNLMENPKNIRNISVIAHVDHGKSTLTDSLVSKAGIIAKEKAGEARFTDTRADEQERSITIKSTSVSLYYKYAEKEKEEEEFLINLIDSPGHVDFSSEVTAALRVTDGALVVVDCVEGVCIQTETVLRQAVSERIKPVLFLNKLDRIFIETEIEFEEAYINFRKIIENVNVIISTYKDMENVNLQVDPVAGNVGFGSGAHAWGFTIRQFAEMYAQDEAGVAEYTKRFWGDHFYNTKTRKWANKAISKDWVRGFCYFVMRPLKRFIKCMMDGEKKTMDSFVKKMKIPLPEDVDILKGKELMKNVMRNWIPAGDALLTMIVKHIPSPVQAQRYRYETLYTGELNDEFAISIRDCNQKGPLVLFVSKMVPAIEKGKFYAFGRVFSGCVTSGQRVRIMGANFTKEDNHDLYTKNIQRTVLMMGRFVEQIVDVPAGNVVGLVGVDDVILKSATIVDHSSTAAMPLKMMKFSVSPVVSVAVDTKNAQDLPKLVEGLKKLSKSDPLVTCTRNSTGQHIIAGAGELHLEICLKDLGEFMKGSEVRVSDPVVTFCETVTRETEKVCVAKSPNKHNRIYMTAEPLAEGVCVEIEDKKLTENMDVKVRAARLASDYDWDLNEARKIWSFGCVPEATANILLDASKGVQYLNEIKDSMKGAFMRATSTGVVCEERLRGVTFKIVDVTLHADAIHRGAGQIMPAARRAFCACQLSAGPSLLEPVYTVEISVPQQSISGVYSVLNKNRGVVEEEKRNPNNPIMKMVCSLPVMESMGFVSKLRAETAGQAFAQMSFSHWQPLSGELSDVSSKTYSVVMDVRKRKGLVEEIPDFNDYYDRV